MSRVLTIGHSNGTLERFLELLKLHCVQVVADVRSHPYSKYSPHFDREGLAKSLATAGLRYVFLGRELGGRPPGEEYYDADGRVLYGKVADSPPFQEGLARLERGLRDYTVALLCSEEDPGACHRRLLVGRVLGERGFSVEHIRGDGRLQTEPQLAAEAGPICPDQLSLFEELSWKSIPSVLPRRRPNSSSAF